VPLTNFGNPALQLLYVDNVAAEPCAKGPNPAYPAKPWAGTSRELLTWIKGAVPADVTLSAPTPTVAGASSDGITVIGGQTGYLADVFFKTIAPCSFVAITVWQTGNPFGLSQANEPFRLAALDVHGAVVLIAYFGTRADLATEDAFLANIVFD